MIFSPLKLVSIQDLIQLSMNTVVTFKMSEVTQDTYLCVELAHLHLLQLKTMKDVLWIRYQSHISVHSYIYAT